MARYIYTVIVECDTAAQAEQVIAERLGTDEDYGFDYMIEIDYSS